MSSIAIGKPIPDFSLPATNNHTIRLSDFKGKNIVLYFYPKDCTSGCTLEGQDFRDHYKQFQTLNTEVWGVSRDTLKLHEKFKSEQQFPFALLSDSEEKLCHLFDVIKEKNMYGKKVKGIERSTFLIDATGKLVREWRKVNVEGHVKEVLHTIKEFSTTIKK